MKIEHNKEGRIDIIKYLVPFSLFKKISTTAEITVNTNLLTPASCL
jgi:hypothetical protein